MSINNSFRINKYKYSALSLLGLSIGLVACQSPPITQDTRQAISAQSTSTQELPHQARPQTNSNQIRPALKKIPAVGQVQFKDNTLKLRLSLPTQDADFTTQKLDFTSATKIVATVTDSNGNSYSPVGEVAGKVDYPGDTLTLTFENVVPDPLIFVEVSVYDENSPIPQAELAVVLSHTTTAEITTSINFNTTSTAKAMKSLMGTSVSRARAINLSDLNTLMNTITGLSGDAPNFIYTTHPTLVNWSKLATDLNGADANTLNAADYRLNGATIALNISGLLGADTLQVQVTDAASAVSTNLGNGNSSTIANVTPGSGIKVLASDFGSPANKYKYISIPSTIAPSENGTTNVNVLAVPVSISGLAPSSGKAGSSVVITGTGFGGAGLIGTTAVNFNGTPAASFTVDNPTQITATVPEGASDGPITVVSGGTSVNSSAFNVVHRIHVKHDATGDDTGKSWADAYPSLQAALTAANAGDEIWIAAGTYTPHASDRDVFFQLKENVNIYGGFAGTESSVADRTASLTDFVTVLSGDLNGNDNYTTPGSTLDENTRTVVRGANNTLLDGVTIQGANSGSEGGGMYNLNSSPTLTNVSFSNNSAFRGGGIHNSSSSPALTNISFSGNSGNGGGGGGMYNVGSSPTLTNVSFSTNSATGSFGGGGMYNSSSSPTLTNVTFSGNSASNTGGGMSNIDSSPMLTNVAFSGNSANKGGGMDNATSSSPMLRDVTFSGNSAFEGGGIYNVSSSPMLVNVTFSGNSATNNGGGIYNFLNCSPTLTHVTFSRNSATNSGGGIYNDTSSSANLKNVLFFNSNLTNQSLGGSSLGNRSLSGDSDDPFINSADPDGADNIPRTADDGLTADSLNCG